MNDYKFYWMDDDGNPIEEIDGIHEAAISCDEPVYNFIEAEEEINSIVTLFANVLEGVTECFKEVLEVLNELLHKLKELFEISQQWPISWKIGMIITVNLKIIKVPP